MDRCKYCRRNLFNPCARDTDANRCANASAEHALAMQAVGIARMSLNAEHVRPQLELLDEAERRSHSVGHILDPTLYRDQINSASFADQMTLVRAALAFLRATDEIEAKHRQE